MYIESINIEQSLNDVFIGGRNFDTPRLGLYATVTVRVPLRGGNTDYSTIQDEVLTKLPRLLKEQNLLPDSLFEI